MVIAEQKSVKVGADDVGNFFKDADGHVWKMISYVDEPQATFVQIDADPNPYSLNPMGGFSKPVVEHVVGCLNYNRMGLKRLVEQVT